MTGLPLLRVATVVALALWGLAAAGGETAPPTAALREIREILAPDYTRLVIDLGRAVPYRVERQPANAAAGVPERLVLELDGTRLVPGAPTSRSPSGGPLLRLRATQRGGNVVRIVLDVPGLDEVRVFPLLDPFRLVVDVHGAPRPLERSRSARSPAEGAPATAGPSPPAVAGPAPPPGAASPRSLTVMVDPGHGGKDPGAQGPGGLREKDVVLEVAKVLAERLAEQGHRALLTRDRDVFLPLEERTARAIAAKADLFVSVHANASPDPDASGIETYYLSNSDDRATLRLARMENQLSHMTRHAARDQDVSLILSDMIQNYKVAESLQLAERIQTALMGRARVYYGEVRDLGFKPGPFYVLVGAGMPAVLAEVSFVSNRQEEARLARPEYRRRLAEGLAAGIRDFVNRMDKAATL